MDCIGAAGSCRMRGAREENFEGKLLPMIKNINDIRSEVLGQSF